jgi:DNA-binding MarR family transcriptional regulator
MSDQHGIAGDEVLGSAGYLLVKAGHYIGMAFEQAMRDCGLSMRELLVLSFVAHTEGLSQQELSDRLGLDPTIVVGLIDGLEDRDLVVRAKDPDDRRRNVLAVTTAGRRLRSKAVAAAEAVQDDFLAPLDGDRRELLREALSVMMVPRLAWLR